MSIISKLLHKWFDLEPDMCPNCEVLKSIIEQERFEKGKLIQTIVDLSKPAPVENVTIDRPEPIRPKHVPWRIRQQELETKDREEAQLLAKKRQEMAAIGHEKTSVEELEAEVGIAAEERLNGSK